MALDPFLGDEMPNSPVTILPGVPPVPIWSGIPNGISVLVINNDPNATIYVGYSSNISANGPNTIPLGPLASVTLDGSQTIYATVKTLVLPCTVIPGGSSYSPGLLAINGNVNAVISGNVNVTNTPSVNVANSPAVTISGTPNVAITGTPTVDIGNSPSVTISGTPLVDINAGTVDVVGTGGTFPPGVTASLYHNAAVLTQAPGGPNVLLNKVNIAGYNSLDLSFIGQSVNSGTTGTPTALNVLINFYDLSSILVNSFTFNIPLGWNTQGGCQAIFSVPCFGSLVTVEFFNEGSTGSIVIPANGVAISGSFRILTDIVYSDANQNNGTINGIIYTAAFAVSPSWVAQISNPTMTAGSTYAFLLSSNGNRVTGFYRANGTPTTLVFVDLGADTTLGNVGAVVDQTGVFYEINVAAAGNIQYLDFIMPPSTCAVITSPSGSGQSFNLNLMSQV